MSSNVQSQAAATKSKQKDEKLLPSLSVKADPSLKSCLSTTSLHKHPVAPEHPQFVVRNDNISPNKHGLVNEDPNVITKPLTPAFTAKDSPNSILSSAPNSPPSLHHTNAALGLSNAHSTGGISMANTNSSGPSVSVHAAAGSSTSSIPQLSHISPPLSRVSSLRYVNDDKKTQRTASPASISTSPQLEDYQDPSTINEKKHLLIAVTGCISIYKNIFLIIEKLFELYSRDKLEIQVVLTKSAQWFLSEKLHKFETLGVKVWFHDDGWKYYSNNKLPYNPGKPMKLTPALISKYSLAWYLQRWTDVLLIAPLSANTMAKIIHGLSDNLLLDMLHQWPLPTQTQQSVPTNGVQTQSCNSQANHIHSNSIPGPGPKPDNTVLSNSLHSPKSIIAALALTNTMYAHPITKIQLKQLQETYPNMLILKPVEKCVDVDGNISMGGMRSWREVVNYTAQKLGHPDEDEDEEDIIEEEKEEQREELEERKLVERRKSADGKINDNTTRYLHDAVSMKEIKEHNKIATINAILNTGSARSQT